MYYSGHGAPDVKTKKSYLVQVDCNPNYIQTGGYALTDLYSTLNDIEAKSTTVVIDACFSGSSSFYDYCDNAVTFSVSENVSYQGVANLKSEWRIIENT